MDFDTFSTSSGINPDLAVVETLEKILAGTLAPVVSTGPDRYSAECKDTTSKLTQSTLNELDRICPNAMGRKRAFCDISDHALEDLFMYLQPDSCPGQEGCPTIQQQPSEKTYSLHLDSSMESLHAGCMEYPTKIRKQPHRSHLSATDISSSKHFPEKDSFERDHANPKSMETSSLDLSVLQDIFAPCAEAFSPEVSAGNSLDGISSVQRSYSPLSQHERFNFENYLKIVHAMPFSSQIGVCCQYCQNRVFHRRYDLTMHIRTEHLFERRFQCDICDARFKRKAHMEAHVKSVHVGIEKVPCKYCGKEYSSESSRRKHIRTIHSTVFYD
jgi:hypothetical protein